jgi:XTP/dITP diphosphohydrolase
MLIKIKFMEIIFASSNQNKAKEIQAALPQEFIIKTLLDLGCHEEIPETADTFAGNALLKAHFVAEKWNLPCFSDDSGLEIIALNNEPGVYSARYAGPQRNDDENMNLVLEKLQNETNRKACFKTVIALIIDGKTLLFEGKVEGDIRLDKRGNQGFGYDPIFEPEGLGKTFAEMNIEEKSNYSHRKRAVDKMISYLSTHF